MRVVHLALTDVHHRPCLQVGTALKQRDVQGLVGSHLTETIIEEAQVNQTCETSASKALLLKGRCASSAHPIPWCYESVWRGLC